jgi:hypothetical protein
MTGIDFGIGFLLVRALFFLFFISFINVCLFIKFDFYKNKKQLIRYLMLIFLVGLSCFLTVLIIRNFRKNGFTLLYIYSISISLLSIIKQYLNNKKQQ